MNTARLFAEAAQNGLPEKAHRAGKAERLSA